MRFCLLNMDWAQIELITIHKQTVSCMTNAMFEKASIVSPTISRSPIFHHAQELMRFSCFGVEDHSARGDNGVSCSFKRMENGINVTLLFKNQLHHYYLHSYLFPTLKNGILQFNAFVVPLL